MKTRTEAVIISSMGLGEADKLVTFYSLDRGLLKGVAKNARKSFRRFGAGLESFTHVRLYLYEREHQELARIEAADIISQHPRISGDLIRAAAGSVMLDFARELSPPGERNAQVFLLLMQVIHLLDAGEEPLGLLCIFTIKFLSLLGYQPKLDRCLSCGRPAGPEMIFLVMKGGVLCPDCMVSSGGPRTSLSAGASGFFYQALRMDMDKVTRLKPSHAIVHELDELFYIHTVHILGKRLKSMEFLRTVLPLEG
jgi:DNA repair protein RecO (recombination protein O)